MMQMFMCMKFSAGVLSKRLTMQCPRVTLMLYAPSCSAPTGVGDKGTLPATLAFPQQHFKRVFAEELGLGWAELLILQI